MSEAASIVLRCGRTARFDLDDLPLVQGRTWRSHPTANGALWYCVFTLNRRPLNPVTVRMHHVILGVPSSVRIDHRNGDGLDNQRHNLRPATRSQNQANRVKRAGATSRFKGVCKDGNRWLSYIGASNDRLGSFSAEEDAAMAYDRAARERYGEFARLNFPIGGEYSAIPGE